MIDIKKITAKIRDAVYGLDVRESIAEAFDATYDNEQEHKRETEERINTYKEDTDKKIDIQNDRIDEILERYDEVISSGTDELNIIEIMDARAPFATLRQRLDCADIKIGSVEEGINKTLTVINDEGEITAVINKDKSQFSKLEVANLVCNNVVSVQNAVKLYVNAVTGDNGNNGLTEDTAFKTIQQAINTLEKHLNGAVFIYIAPGTYDEKINILSFQGWGTLNIVLSENVIINGEIVVNACSSAIKLSGNTTSKAVLNHNTTRTNAVSVFTSAYVLIENFIVNGNADTKYTVNINTGSGVSIKNCEINNSTIAAITAFECSKIYAINNKGNNHSQYSVYSASGSTICMYNTIPDAPQENWCNTGVLYGTAVKTPGNTTIMPDVYQNKNYGSVNQFTYRQVGNRDAVYQGKYDSKNGDNYLHYGMYVLDSDKIRTEMKNKTIHTVNITVRRYEEGQGIGQPSEVSLKFWGSTAKTNASKPVLLKEYITVKNIKKGQTITFSMPAAFIQDVLNSNVNSLVLYTADGSSYCRMADDFDMEIIYK